MGRIATYDFEGEYVTWTTDGANAGTVFYRNGKFNCTNVCGTLFPKGKLSMPFLAYVLGSVAKNYVSYVGNPKLMNNIVAKIEIRLPDSFTEQSTIANILTTIDQAIEKTEQIIAKYERIKTGLMQDLLTRGIDEQGNIRSEETHEFKDSPLGRIPKEWDWNRLTNMVDEVLDFKANGSFERLTANVKYYNESNYGRLIRLTDLRQDLSNNGVYVDEIGYNFLAKTRLKEGDILISCVGEYTGFVCRMPKVSYPATIAPNMFLIRFKGDFDSKYINYYMNFSPFQRQIAEVSTSSATKLLNNPNLRALKFAFPKKREQEQIVEYIEPVSVQIEGYKSELKNLNNLKSGLMQDLLTGKVRVDALINQMPESI
jgi:type I restriction enzyme S subunit